MILVRDDMSHLFEIDNALTHGEVVSIPADRVWGSQKSIQLPFLGHEARFPMGPFSVATMRGLDVVCVNVMKTSTRGYLILVTPLDYDKEAPRREQTRQLAEAYVSVLEGTVRRYPTQWYNYFDFWI
jgi:predicted LPLAT superfamily acyltransferase